MGVKKEESALHMPCVIGTAGHIDHGKTSLVAALTGVDTDRLKEEKKRGLSIDLGFARMQFDDGSFAAMVDVPGHERFVRNMLAGSTGVDVVLFCVAADDGIMPQTIEHFDIVTLLGIRKGVFCVSKSDTVNVERVRRVCDDVTGMLDGTLLNGSPVLPISVRTGEGLDELKRLLFAAAKEAARSSLGKAPYFRLPVDRSFAIKGFGAVVTGTVASGTVSVDEEVMIFPSGIKARVRGIESHGEKIVSLTPGKRGAVNLAGISYNEISRGDMLLGPSLSAYSSGVRTFDCKLNVLKHAAKISKERRIFTLYHFTKETPAALRFHDVKEVLPGQTVYARVHLRAPLMCLPDDKFILRDPSINATVAGGSVLAVYPYDSIVPKSADSGCSLLAEGNAQFFLTSVINKYGGAAPLIDLEFIAGKENFDACAGDFVLLGGQAATKQNYNTLISAITTVLSDFHSKNPTQPGMNAEALLAKAAAACKQMRKPAMGALFRAGLMDALVANGTIEKSGGIYSLKTGARMPGQNVYSDEAEAIIKAIGNGFSTVKKEDILKLRMERNALESALNALVGQKRIRQIARDVYISGEAIDRAKEMLGRFCSDNGTIKASDFRTLLGCGRKLAIEILEYFDKERITLRVGDERKLR